MDFAILLLSQLGFLDRKKAHIYVWLTNMCFSAKLVKRDLLCLPTKEDHALGPFRSDVWLAINPQYGISQLVIPFPYKGQPYSYIRRTS